MSEQDRLDEAAGQIARLLALKRDDPEAWRRQRDRRTELEVARQAAVRETWTEDDLEKMNDYKARLKREGRANETEEERETRLEKRVYDRARPKPKKNDKTGKRTLKSRSAASEPSDGEHFVDKGQFGDGVGEDDEVESGEEDQL